MKEVYVILESYTDYKGGNASSFGVFTSKESAKKALPSTIAERLGYDSVEELEEDCDIFFDDHYVNNEQTHWCWDSGDDIVEFYIQKDDLNE